MTSCFALSRFTYIQKMLLYCAFDSYQYTTELLIERNLPGRVGPPPYLDQEDLSSLAQEGWVSILGKQIDIETSIAVQVHHQRLVTAIENPHRAELIAAAQPVPPKVVMARIQYQCTDRAILRLTPYKIPLKTQFERSETLSNGFFETQHKGDSQRIYIMSMASVGNFSIKVPLPRTDLTEGHNNLKNY